MKDNEKNKYTEQEIREISEKFFNMIFQKKEIVKKKKIKLVIDMPSNCQICPFSYYTEGCFSSFCNLNGRKFEEIENLYGCNDNEGFLDERPEWCPLNNCEVVE